MLRSLSRLTSLGALVLLLPLGCVDAPITQEQLEADGQLRTPGPAPRLDASAFAAQPRPEPVQRAAQISAVLAAQPVGALEDTSEFVADVGTVHLHLRADGSATSRNVVFRWTHDGVSVTVPGTLEPGDALSLASSFPVEPTQVGPWRVEVLSDPGRGREPTLLFERAFEVVPLGPAASPGGA